MSNTEIIKTMPWIFLTRTISIILHSPIFGLHPLHYVVKCLFVMLKHIKHSFPMKIDSSRPWLLCLYEVNYLLTDVTFGLKIFLSRVFLYSVSSIIPKLLLIVLPLKYVVGLDFPYSHYFKMSCCKINLSISKPT